MIIDLNNSCWIFATAGRVQVQNILVTNKIRNFPNFTRRTCIELFKQVFGQLSLIRVDSEHKSPPRSAQPAVKSAGRLRVIELQRLTDRDKIRICQGYSDWWYHVRRGEVRCEVGLQHTWSDFLDPH